MLSQLSLVSFLVVAAAACQKDARFLMVEETLVEPSGARHLGSACNLVSDGTRGGTGGGMAGGKSEDQFSVRYEGIDDGVRVVVSVGTRSVERAYDATWLRGETPAEIVEIQMDQSRIYRVRLSGGVQCVNVKPDASAGH